MFSERSVEANGVRLRYREAGQGVPLVHLQDALRLTPAHDLLSRHFRVLVVELAEALGSPEPLLRALTRIGLDTFDLMATSIASPTALRLALQAPARIPALVLEAPAGDRDAELEGRLPSLPTPTLVLCGTRDGGRSARIGPRIQGPVARLVTWYSSTMPPTPSAPSARRPSPRWSATSSSVARRSSSAARRR